MLLAEKRDIYPQMPKKVLVVEDNSLNLKLFNDLLESQGFDVIESKDGKNIVAITEAAMPEIIIIDIQLPEISGIDIIQALKANDVTKNIPVIAVTAFAMKGDKENILSTGCEEYMCKPISIQDFITVVNNYTNNDN